MDLLYETMESKKRFFNTLKGEEKDRVPLDLKSWIGVQDIETWIPSEVEKIKNIEDSKYKGFAKRVTNKIHYFFNIPSYINRYFITPPEKIAKIGEEEGKKGKVSVKEIKTPEENLRFKEGFNPKTMSPWMVEYPVKSIEDLEKIRSIPWHPPQDLTSPEKKVKNNELLDQCVISTRISSPVVCVAGLMKYEYFLKLCAEKIDLIEELTEICTKRTLTILDTLLEDDVIEYVWMGGSEWLTPPMGSPKLYDRLVQEYEKPIIDKIHDANAFSHVHCHGNVADVLEKMIDRGADLTEPVEPPPDGDIEFSKAKEIASDRIVLGGNVESRILAKGDENDVEEATKAAFKGRKDNMVLTPSVQPINLNQLSSQEIKNYHKMIDVWEDLSPL